MNNMSAGFVACYFLVLRHCIYALQKGYIPVIDFKHFDNIFFKDGKQFVDNSWEYFFEQPCGKNLEDLKEGSRIILSSRKCPVDYFPSMHDFLTSGDRYLEYFDIIKLNKETKLFCEETYEKLIKPHVGNDNEILGILCRGTDYTKLRPVRHYIQPEPQQVIDKAKELLEKYHYKKIWLATEDAEIYKLFKQEFKDVLIDNPSYMYSDVESDIFLTQNKVDREDHFYKVCRDYLVSLYILSKCKYFIGGITTAIFALYPMTQAFKNQKYVYFWSLGRYKITKKIEYRNIAERLFSTKNEYYEDTKRKVFTILGIRIKLKKRKFKLSGGIEIIDGKVVNKK